MKIVKGILFLSLLLLQTVHAQHSSDYEQVLMEHRQEKDAELKDKKESPLQKQDRKRFKHLNYFEIEPSWNLVARAYPIDATDTLNIATSSGHTKHFIEHTMLVFEHDGKMDTLWALVRVWPKGQTPTYEPELFVPFTDLTTGDACYGGGRYLDLPIPEEDEDTIVIDFNYCYNPYCAYGDGFSCPIPPKKNFINQFVNAGERAYDAH